MALGTDKKFAAENDMRTLVAAAKIKKDRPRMEAAMKMAREQRKALSDITNSEDK